MEENSIELNNSIHLSEMNKDSNMKTIPDGNLKSPRGRGRPRKYETNEERQEAKSIQTKNSKERKNMKNKGCALNMNPDQLNFINYKLPKIPPLSITVIFEMIGIIQDDLNAREIPHDVNSSKLFKELVEKPNKKIPVYPSPQDFDSYCLYIRAFFPKKIRSKRQKYKTKEEAKEEKRRQSREYKQRKKMYDEEFLEEFTEEQTKLIEILKKYVVSDKTLKILNKMYDKFKEKQFSHFVNHE
jgi:hypothetical protein